MYTTRVAVLEWLKAVLFGFAGMGGSWRLVWECRLGRIAGKKGTAALLELSEQPWALNRRIGLPKIVGDEPIVVPSAMLQLFS